MRFGKGNGQIPWFSRETRADLGRYGALRGKRGIVSLGMISAQESLARLKAGNIRFSTNCRETEPHPLHANLAERQQPFAIILGCSDSRVPAELVFDQGFGDLFVIRVAGNIVAPSQVGSVEFAASQFGTNLVVVLGHSGCGAIQATYDALTTSEAGISQNINSIIQRIQPAMETLLLTDLRHDRERLIEHAVRANVRASANHLRHGSAVLEKLIADNGLLVVGAEYSLETGVVDFFDGVPAAW